MQEKQLCSSGETSERKYFLNIFIYYFMVQENIFLFVLSFYSSSLVYL